MKKEQSNISNVFAITAIISIGSLIICFLLNRYVIPSQPPWNYVKTVLGAITAIFCIVSVMKWISFIMERKKTASVTNETPENSKPLKIWTQTELFAYLEQEDIIDLQIDHDGILKVGVASEFCDKKFSSSYYFNKCYYIADAEYTDIDDFKRQFVLIHPEEDVIIIHASMDNGGMDIIL